MAKRLLQDVPAPARVAYLFAHTGHAGHEMRAQGFFDAMPAGTQSDKVVIGEEPQAANDPHLSVRQRRCGRSLRQRTGQQMVGRCGG